MTSPANLDQLRQIRSEVERATAAQSYISAREEAIAQARKIRDEAIRSLAAQHGPAKAARMCAVSLSLVKQIRR